MSGEQEKKEQAKKILEKEEEIKQLSEAESMIKDNKIEFPYKENTYRVRLTTTVEKQQAEYQRMLKRQVLLADGNYWTEEKWEREWAKRGRDSKELKEKIKILKNKREEFLLNLEEYRKEDVRDEAVIKAKEDEIRKIELEIKEVSLKLEEIYEYTVQNKLEEFTRYYSIYQALEIKDGDKWESVFKNFDEFMKSDDDNLIVIAGSKLAWLVVHYNINK